MQATKKTWRKRQCERCRVEFQPVNPRNIFCPDCQKPRWVPMHNRPAKNKYPASRFPRLRRAWRGMKTRCYNPKCTVYSFYGGRDVSVCNEWRFDFQSFAGWALANGYSDDLSIDRIDSNRGYGPENCQSHPELF